MKTDPALFRAKPKRLNTDLSRTGVVITDWKRSITFLNSQICKRTGYRQEELLGSLLYVLYRKENRAKYSSVIKNRLTRKGEWSGDIEIQRRDGSSFQAEALIVAFKGVDGKLAGTISIFQEPRQFTRNGGPGGSDGKKLHRIISSMEDALYISDENGRILMCNEAHSRMLGCKPQEILGRKPPYPWLDSSDNRKMLKGYRLLRKEGRLINFTVSWKGKEGNLKVVSLSMSKITGSPPKSGEIVVTARDITDVQYAEELQRANEQINRLITDVKFKAKRLETLQNTNFMVLENTSIRRIFKAITAGISKLVDHDLAGIYTYDPEKKLFSPHTLSKHTQFSRRLAKFPLQWGEGIIGSAAASGKMVMANNAQQDPRSSYPEGMKPVEEHFIAVPLKGRDSIFGILVVARNRDPQFIEEEAVILESFANALTIALENSRLVQELNRWKRPV